MGADDLVYGTDGTYHTKTETFAKVTNTGGFAPAPIGRPDQERDVPALRVQRRLADRGSRQRRRVRVWAIDKVMDKNGNYMEVSYSEDTTNGDYYPDTIVYTKNTGISTYRYVKFFWESRTDVSASYAKGRWSSRSAAERIETYVGGTLDANRVNKYALTLFFGLRREIPAVVGEGVRTSADTTGLPATSFTYKSLTTGFGSEQSWGNARYGRHFLRHGRHRRSHLRGSNRHERRWSRDVCVATMARTTVSG